jgi:hypothetical protein
MTGFRYRPGEVFYICRHVNNEIGASVAPPSPVGPSGAPLANSSCQYMLFAERRYSNKNYQGVTRENALPRPTHS